MSEGYLSSRQKLSQSGFSVLQKLLRGKGKKVIECVSSQYYTCDLGMVHSESGIVRRQLRGWQRGSMSI